MVKRVSTRFLDADTLSDGCYGWADCPTEDDRPVVNPLSEEEIDSLIAPKRRGRPKRPYLPPTSTTPEKIDDLGSGSDDGKFAWE